MIHANHRCQAKLVAVGLCFALFLALPSEVRAQTLYGSIVGNVTDASDAAIVGATVQILNKGTNETRQTVTNEAGAYNLATVQSGTYEVTVSMAGFKKYTESQVNVTLNTLTRVDVKLDVGELTETVTVAAEVAQLQTDRAEVKSELVSKVLHDLPVVTGRNYQQAAFCDAAGDHAPSQCPLDSVQPFTRSDVQCQRRHPRFEQHSH